MRFALYEGEIVDIDLCLSQLSDIKYTEEMCLKYVRGLKEIENFLRKSYGSLMGIFPFSVVEMLLYVVIVVLVVTFIRSIVLTYNVYNVFDIHLA